MTEQAEYYNKQGLQLIQVGRLDEAIEFFTKAIDIDPDYAPSYHNRGETYLSLNRIIEGNTDIQRAKDLRSGKLRIKKNQAPTSKISIDEVDSIYDKVFPTASDDIDNSPLEFDDSLYDYVFSDDTIKTDEAWDGIVKPAPTTDSFPAILEFIGGKRVEVAASILFQPTKNDISLLRKDGYVERVISLDQLQCIRTEGVPSQFAKDKTASCHVEIIETVDGSIYHESVHPDQSMEHVLFGFSTKEQTRFVYSLIPTSNIKKRCQERYLGDILLEKRFIANDILKRALDEHQQSRSMKIGKIIAQKAKVIYSTIENELEKARQEGAEGLKTGEILLASGLVNEDQVLQALEYQENIQKVKIGEFLVEKGIIQEKEVYIALAEKFRLPFVDLRKQKVSKKILKQLPAKFVLEHEVLPIWLENGVLKVATMHPDVTALCEKILTECKCQEVIFVLAQPTHLRNIINLLYKRIGVGR